MQSQVSQFADKLMPGDQIDPANPRRWLLISDEAGVPDRDQGSTRWSIDHLFLDQEGIPTLVEVKRSSDTRIRREVVGQMFDYAANAVQFWSVGDVQRLFEQSRENEEANLVLEQFLRNEQSAEEFWGKVKTNLQARRIRMIFLADVIPPELQRVVEFLNAQMDPAEVLAVQVKHYDGTFDNKSIKALVPQVLGASVIKPSASSPREKHKWTETEFMSALAEKRGPDAMSVAKKILDWAVSHGLRIWWGEGKTLGTFYAMYSPEGGAEDHNTFAVWTSGEVAIQFGSMLNKPPFSDEARRLELMDRLNRIPHVSLPVEKVGKYPSFQVSNLIPGDAFKQFTDTWEWYFQWVCDCADSQMTS